MNKRPVYRDVREGISISWSKRESDFRESVTTLIETLMITEERTYGLFSDPRSAAIAYDAAALEYHGSHSTTNESLGLLSKTLDIPPKTR